MASRTRRAAPGVSAAASQLRSLARSRTRSRPESAPDVCQFLPDRSHSTHAGAIAFLASNMARWVSGDALRAAGDHYWVAQTDALMKSAQAWRLAATGDAEGAITSMTAAADEKGSLKKLPPTSGPIVPAREQLGELYLVVSKPLHALTAFNAALAMAPGRLSAIRGRAKAAHKPGSQ